MDIVQHISTLIFDHDCVIVPGFGGFVSNYQTAKIHPVQHSFNPPSKTILFNKNLNSNDGLLANHLVSKEQISYEKALTAIKEVAAQWTLNLSNGQAISLENIGTLYAEKEGNIQFDQNSNINFLKDVYGMTSFVSPAIRRDNNRNHHQIRTGFSDRQKPQKQISFSGKIIRIAATTLILAMLTIAGFNYFSPPKSVTNEANLLPTIDHFVENEAILNQDAVMPAATSNKTTEKKPSSFKNTTVPEPVQNVNIETNNTKTNKIVVQNNEDLLAENSGVDTENNASLPIPEIKPLPVQKEYHLIVGSFQEPENATLLIDRFRQNGYNPAIVGPSDNGYYRVSIAAYLKKSDALVELKKVRENFDPNTWLLRQ